MGKKKSSFHMGDEFNGNGQKVYLRPTQHHTYTPLSQQGVKLTPDFSQFVPKAIGAIPVGCKSANTESKTALKALGGIPSVSQVMIEKDAKTGSYQMKGRVRRRQLTTGSYLHSTTNQAFGSSILTGAAIDGIFTVAKNMLEEINETENETGNGTENECIIIDNWLYLFSEPTVSSEGRHVLKHPDAANYDWAMPEELSGKNNELWFEKISPASEQIESNGGVLVARLNENNLYTDSEGRYWVAVGPNVMNPDHQPERVQVTAEEMHYGTKLDIVVEDGNGVRFYIPAVVGDAKEHSYPDGLYQTGVPFDINRGIVESNPNTVEFIGYHIVKNERNVSSVNVTNNYRLIEIIVYDGILNYE